MEEQGPMELGIEDNWEIDDTWRWYQESPIVTPDGSDGGSSQDSCDCSEDEVCSVCADSSEMEDVVDFDEMD